MELLLLSNGKLSGESELLGYAKERIQAVLKSARSPPPSLSLTR